MYIYIFIYVYMYIHLCNVWSAGCVLAEILGIYINAYECIYIYIFM
jgi:hypothetical protein